MTEKTTDELLSERGARYGNFSEIASWTERQMAGKFAILDANPWWRELLRNEKEVFMHGLYMMTVKEARLLHGDVTLPDNFDDIAGYAKLVARMLNKRSA